VNAETGKSEAPEGGHEMEDVGIGVRLHRSGRRGAVLLAVVSLTASAATGCGGGGDNGLSKSELVNKANAICKPHTEKIRAASGKLLAGGQLPSPQRFGKLARGTIVPEVSAQVKQLRDLKPSDDLADDYKKWLDESEAVVGKMRKDPSIITSPTNFKAVNREAAGLGVSRDCNIGPS